MDQGAVIADGPPAEVLARPRRRRRLPRHRPRPPSSTARGPATDRPHRSALTMTPTDPGGTTDAAEQRRHRGADRGQPLRRWGPLPPSPSSRCSPSSACSSSRGGGDDDDEDDDAPRRRRHRRRRRGEPPEGAISFAEAEEEGTLDAAPSARRPATRRPAAWPCPYYFAPECYADVETTAARPTPGVTADTIKVVVYVARGRPGPRLHHRRDQRNDDTNAQVGRDLQGYADMFNAIYQTYGRTVELEFLDGLRARHRRGGGPGRRREGGRGDGRVRRVGRPGAVQRLDRGDQAPAGGVCIGCPALARRRAVACSPSSPRPARPAGTGRVRGQEAGRQAGRARRRRGDARPGAGVRPALHRHRLGRRAGRASTSRTSSSPRPASSSPSRSATTLDPGTLAEQAATAIARLKAAGVTTRHRRRRPDRPEDLHRGRPPSRTTSPSGS